MTAFLHSVQREYPALFWVACFNALLIVPSLAGLAFDPRQVAGINPWIKPLKFEVSVAIYVLTIGWMLLNLPAAETSKRLISFGVALTMACEIAAIVFQAARGVSSHFNEGTPFDAVIFGMMGLLITVNTLVAAWLTVLYFVTPVALPPALLWGIRLSLILFLLASAEGFLIVRNMAHTVGAPDGGSGLPFLNWSTQWGDLRVAHFLGMHGIQLLPLLGFLLSRHDRDAGVLAVTAVFTVLTALFVLTLVQAFAARPLLRL